MAQKVPWEVTRHYTDKVLVWADSERSAQEQASVFAINCETAGQVRIDWTLYARQLTEERG